MELKNYSIISIHALLAESDTSKPDTLAGLHRISIHALLAESDVTVDDLRGDTENISIHALLAESDLMRFTPFLQIGQIISIHALLAESAWFGSRHTHSKFLFLSTLSLRRATGSITVASVI